MRASADQPTWVPENRGAPGEAKARSHPSAEIRPGFVVKYTGHPDLSARAAGPGPPICRKNGPFLNRAWSSLSFPFRNRRWKFFAKLAWEWQFSPGRDSHQPVVRKLCSSGLASGVGRAKTHGEENPDHCGGGSVADGQRSKRYGRKLTAGGSYSHKPKPPIITCAIASFHETGTRNGKLALASVPCFSRKAEKPKQGKP